MGRARYSKIEEIRRYCMGAYLGVFYSWVRNGRADSCMDTCKYIEEGGEGD
jgi:hypothetical protein